MSANKNNLTWVEISADALRENIRQFRKLLDGKILCVCVKANAYGHGLVEASKIFLEAGADWLSVNSLYEARKLRESGVSSPIYILGYVPFCDLEEAVDLNTRIVVYNKETVLKLSEIGKPVKIHLKVETGNNRQGILTDEIVDFAKFVKKFPNIEIEGVSSHFANIEDTTDHSFAEKQLARFNDAVKKLESEGIKIPIRHMANSAATILFPKTHYEMVRIGISAYGMWSSHETYVSSLGGGSGGSGGDKFNLTPAFTWKTKIAQIKKVPAGEYVGYGCTYKTEHDTKLAILPVGYYDGYDRGVSNGHVLICGKRAPVRGRICMNIIMADVTDIPEAKLEDEVVLIGKSGGTAGESSGETITMEQFASWASTINYEITTRVNERILRIVV
jgi:alanine racemase